MLIFAAAAYAHSGATGAVKMRMDSMKALAAHAKVIGTELRKDTPDFTAIGEAAGGLHGDGAAMRTLFAERDLSVPSEALPVVWDDSVAFAEAIDAYLVSADALIDAVETDDVTIIRSAFGAVGKQCSACHEVFRKPD